ncbi:polo kinase kinase, putative [Pediculus humanus corporis]|uniref:Polo kinase kinase, putative n=1 Tax=Pediculus humanus subsp. corporis TaxID=121224 RepID=E0VYC7_PEDHC|nr:polo kinase kinase, putative [Pediculus humanus corporis]EEB18383.1 polo kinase kinase, putative [Pediculus humanus corporis]
MSFLSNLKKVLHLGASDAKKKKGFNNIQMDCDPKEHWDMIGELGDGAFGKVYKAQNKTTGLLAAAKMCALEGEDDLSDFIVEIDILSECKHPNVVGLHESYFIDGKLWILIEYCDGGALDSIMVELDKPLTEVQIAYISQQMCQGLNFLHQNKVIHRDLKAGNVLLTMDGGVKIADFGVSSKNKYTLQKHDTFIGTPYWMAPEVVLCETFRDNPYDFKMSPMRVLLKIQKSDPPKLDQPSQWSKEFNEFVAKCLVKDPSQRSTAEELLKHPFICNVSDSKPVRDLLLEYKAEVVEEEVVDDEVDVSIFGHFIRQYSNKLQNLGGQKHSCYVNISCYQDVIIKKQKKRREIYQRHRASQIPLDLEPGDDAVSLKSDNEVKGKGYPEPNVEKSRGKGKAPPPPPPLPSPSVPCKTDVTKSQNVNVVNGQQKSSASVSEFVSKSVPQPILPKLNQSKSLENVNNNTKILAKTPPEALFDREALKSTEKPISPLISATNKIKNEIQEDKGGLHKDESNVETRSKSSTDIIVCSGNTGSTVTVTTTDKRNEESSLLSNSYSQVTVVTTHPPVIHMPRDFPSRPPVQTTSQNEVTIVANETNKTQINESSSDFEFLDSLEVNNTSDSSFSRGQKLDESEVFIVNSNYINDRDRREDDVDRPNVKDMSHVSVIKVGDDSSHPIQCSRHNEEKKPSNQDGSKATSIILDGSTVGETESVNNERYKIPLNKRNGDLYQPDNVQIVVNKNNDNNSHVRWTPIIFLQLKNKTNQKNTPLQDKRQSPDGSSASRSVSSSGSLSGRSSESQQTLPTSSKTLDRSDAESISTTTSQDSRESNKENRPGRDSRASADTDEDLVLRRKPEYTREHRPDGVVVTTTTSKVIYGDDENDATYDDHLFRKQELRELKMLQKQEQKQYQDLSYKAQFAKEQQDKRFEQERLQLTRTYESDLDTLARQQRQQVEKAEQQQESDLRAASKKIRVEQERELKQFREGLKQEMRLLKQEIDLMPKDKRKNIFKTRKEALAAEHEQKEKQFAENLNENHESLLRRLSETHREKIALMERQFLQQKQRLLRARESALWDLEERQIHEKQQLAKRQLKDIFFLQRHQMLIRHEKELEQIKRMNQRKEEDLIKRQAVEKRQLPKRIRSEMKAREMMFRESMRISMSAMPDPEAERERLKKFQENEKKRYRAEQQRFELKHQRQLEELRATSEATIKELEQLQNEKRKMLMEHETAKLKEQEEEYNRELKEWKSQLKPRKQVSYYYHYLLGTVNDWYLTDRPTPPPAQKKKKKEQLSIFFSHYYYYYYYKNILELN